MRPDPSVGLAVNTDTLDCPLYHTGWLAVHTMTASPASWPQPCHLNTGLKTWTVSQLEVYAGQTFTITLSPSNRLQRVTVLAGLL